MVANGTLSFKQYRKKFTGIQSLDAFNQKRVQSGKKIVPAVGGVVSNAVHSNAFPY